MDPLALTPLVLEATKHRLPVGDQANDTDCYRSADCDASRWKHPGNNRKATQRYQIILGKMEEITPQRLGAAVSERDTGPDTNDDFLIAPLTFASR